VSENPRLVVNIVPEMPSSSSRRAPGGGARCALWSEQDQAQIFAVNAAQAQKSQSLWSAAGGARGALSAAVWTSGAPAS
jgi:hypothetical protein